MPRTMLRSASHCSCSLVIQKLHACTVSNECLPVGLLPLTNRRWSLSACSVTAINVVRLILYVRDTQTGKPRYCGLLSNSTQECDVLLHADKNKRKA